MEENSKRLKPKKHSKLHDLLAKKRSRYFIMLLFMLPFIVAIGIFSTIAYREAKGLMSMATGTTETKDENLIASMNYILRDNATDIQKEYFAELKNAIENEEAAVDDTTIAGLIGKNYVADFYTWTNKQGQYDIGGLYYVYNGEFENGEHFKENVFLKARDGFYKYINNYINQYGSDKLIEVESVELTKCEKAPWQFLINEHISYKQDDQGEWYDYREDHYYDAYLVSCRWTYKEDSALNLSQFPTSINLLVIARDDRFSIIEASESPITERQHTVEENEDTETNEENETSDNG